MPNTTSSPAKSAESLRKLAHAYKTLWIACTLTECDIADGEADAALDRLSRIKTVLARLGEGSSSAADRIDPQNQDN